MPSVYGVDVANWRSDGAPSDALKPELARTGLDYYLDVNVLTEASEAMASLRRARAEGWVRLQRTDVMDTELIGAPEEKRGALIAESATYVESLGPWVGGHSRGGQMVGGTEVDETRFSRVFAILKPGIGTPAMGRANDVRDAMHVATAIRYASNGFITRDSNILRHGPELAALTPSSFLVLTPEGAWHTVCDAISRTVRGHELTNSTAWLPDWRPPC
jgi:hypothetical protein